MAPGRRLLLASYLVAINLLFLFLVLAVWPGIEWVQLPSKIRFLLIATLAAGWGSAVFALMSFFNLSFKRRLFENWTMWYLTNPFTGLPIGLGVYAAVRFGVLTKDSSLDALNPYFIAVLAALAGYWIVGILRKAKESADKRQWRYNKR